MKNLEFDFQSYYKKFEQGKDWTLMVSAIRCLEDAMTGEELVLKFYCFVN